MSVTKKDISAVISDRYLTTVVGATIFILGGTELLTVLDGTVVALAFPKIEEYFHVSSITANWMITTYILFFSGFLMLGGRLGGIFGRKKVFISGVGILAFASLYSGFAQNFWELICARGVQAVGAAIAAPTAMSYVASLYAPGKTRSTAFAIYGAMMGLGSVLALTAGGILATSAWQWVFWINVPIGLAIVLGAFVVLPKDMLNTSTATKDLDYGGAITAFLACSGIAFTIYLYSGTSRYYSYWLYLLMITILLCGVFAFTESRAQVPVFPARLVAKKNRALALIVNTLAGSVMTCMALLVARYLQEVLHYSPMQSGLAVLPFAGGMGLAMIFSPIATQKIAPRWIIISSGILLLIVLIFVRRYVHHYPGYFPLFFCAVGIIGFGVGLILTSILLSVLADVAIEDTGALSAIQKITMEIGGGIGLVLVIGMQYRKIHTLELSGGPRVFTGDIHMWILEESFGYAVYWIIALIVLAGIVVVFMTYTPAQVSQGIAIKSEADRGAPEQ